jgi:hypothetical protein
MGLSCVYCSSNDILNVQIVSRPEVIDSSGLSASHKPNLCSFGHLKKYQLTGTGSGSGGAASEGDGGGGANLGRRVLGYTRHNAVGAPAHHLYRDGEGPCDMDGVLGDVGDGAMSEVDDVMGGDMVALPDFSFDDDHSDVSPRGVASSNRGGVLASSSTGEEGTTANLRGMLKRQDTFGDEFYENWEKVVTVESGSAPPSVNEVCVFEYRRCLLFMM